MEFINIPIKLISCTNTFGELTPMRFRYEDTEHKLHTIDISEILNVKSIEYVGQEAFIYTCKAKICNEEKMFELKYTVTSHKWLLYRMLN